MRQICRDVVENLVAEDVECRNIEFMRFFEPPGFQGCDKFRTDAICSANANRWPGSDLVADFRLRLVLAAVVVKGDEGDLGGKRSGIGETALEKIVYGRVSHERRGAERGAENDSFE